MTDYIRDLFNIMFNSHLYVNQANTCRSERALNKAVPSWKKSAIPSLKSFQSNSGLNKASQRQMKNMDSGQNR